MILSSVMCFFFSKKCWKIHIVHVALLINLMGFRKKQLPNFTRSFFSYMYTVTTKFSLLFVRLRVVSLFFENYGKNRNQVWDGVTVTVTALLLVARLLVLHSSPRISEEKRDCSQCTFLFSLIDMQAGAIFNHDSLISPKLLTVD